MHGQNHIKFDQILVHVSNKFGNADARSRVTKNTETCATDSHCVSFSSQVQRQNNCETTTISFLVCLSDHSERNFREIFKNKSTKFCDIKYTRVGTLIVTTIYLQLIQNRYMFRRFTVLQCSHQHCVQPVASDVEVVGYLQQRLLC